MNLNYQKEIAPFADEAKVELLKSIYRNHTGNTKLAQRSRLLSAIHKVPISTLEARKYLDVMHPAGRIMELRRRGWLIDTVWVIEQSEIGKPHRIALYVYRGAPK